MEDGFLEELRRLWRELEERDAPPPEAIRRAQDIFPTHRPPSPFVLHLTSLRVASAVLLSILLFFILSTFLAVTASAEALPGDEPLYSVKLISEQVRVLIAPSESAAAILQMHFARVRLEEVARLPALGRDALVPAILTAYKAEIAESSNIVLQAAAHDPQTPTVVAVLQVTLSNTTTLLWF